MRVGMAVVPSVGWDGRGGWKHLALLPLLPLLIGRWVLAFVFAGYRLAGASLR